MIKLKELAYMYKYEPQSFEQYGIYAREYEKTLKRPLMSDWWDVIEKRVKTKWLSILESEEQQINIFDYMEERRDEDEV